MTKNRSVIAIPPSYDRSQKLELDSTRSYVEYLEENKATTVMTTAGTSQFNLLSNDEIHDLNNCIGSSFSGEKILGIPALSSVEAHNFAHTAGSHENTSYMAIYPDRFYDKDSIYRYVGSIVEALGDPVYLHAPKMRAGRGGDWNYDAETINYLYDKGMVVGIKEEHSNLSESFNFISKLNNNLDVIVAGGSMRRFCFLNPAGANSFLAGIGNIFPNIEQEFFHNKDNKFIAMETSLFDVFMEHGWHQSLRIALRLRGLTCFHNRDPWPRASDTAVYDIAEVLDTF